MRLLTPRSAGSDCGDSPRRPASTTAGTDIQQSENSLTIAGLGMFGRSRDRLGTRYKTIHAAAYLSPRFPAPCGSVQFIARISGTLATDAAGHRASPIRGHRGAEVTLPLLLRAMGRTLTGRVGDRAVLVAAIVPE